MIYLFEDTSYRTPVLTKKSLTAVIKTAHLFSQELSCLYSTTLSFLHNDRISYNNNCAKRDIRMAIVKQKIPVFFAMNREQNVLSHPWLHLHGQKEFLACFRSHKCCSARSPLHSPNIISIICFSKNCLLSR